MRVAGWLLTPVVVWAASFLGAWLAARLYGSDGDGRGLVWLVSGALIGGTVGVIGWILVWRRVRRRRQSREGPTAGDAP